MRLWSWKRRPHYTDAPVGTQSHSAYNLLSSLGFTPHHLDASIATRVPGRGTYRPPAYIALRFRAHERPYLLGRLSLAIGFTVLPPVQVAIWTEAVEPGFAGWCRYRLARFGPGDLASLRSVRCIFTDANTRGGRATGFQAAVRRPPSSRRMRSQAPARRGL